MFELRSWSANWSIKLTNWAANCVFCKYADGYDTSDVIYMWTNDSDLPTIQIASDMTLSQFDLVGMTYSNKTLQRPNGKVKSFRFVLRPIIYVMGCWPPRMHWMIFAAAAAAAAATGVRFDQHLSLMRPTKLAVLSVRGRLSKIISTVFLLSVTGTATEARETMNDGDNLLKESSGTCLCTVSSM